MKVLKPIQIAADQWIYYDNNYLEGFTRTAYNPATSYVVGSQVYVDTLKSQFDCIAAAAPGQAPPNATYWVKVGTTVAWRPFDGFLSSVRTALAYSYPMIDANFWQPPQLYMNTVDYLVFPMIKLGKFTTVAVLNTDAAFIRIVFYDPIGNKTYDRVIYSVDQSNVIDAFTYCFSEQNTRRDFVFDGIDGWGVTNLSQLIITVSNAPTGLAGNPDTVNPITVTVGEIVIGEAHEIGACHADAQIQLIDYSKKEIDAYGTVTIVQRAYSLNGSFEIEVPTADRNRVQNLMASLRATPCVYFPSEDDANAGIVIYGYSKDYNTTYQTPERTYASLEIEGMI